MLDKLLSSLQGIPAYSILISAVVVIFIAVSVLVMFGTARQEKRNRTASLGKWSVLTWHCTTLHAVLSFRWKRMKS